jgi:hypothetical protein
VGGHGGDRDPAAGHGRGGDWARGARGEGGRLPEVWGGEDEVAAGAGDSGRRRCHRGWHAREAVRVMDWGFGAPRKMDQDRRAMDGGLDGCVSGGE